MNAVGILIVVLLACILIIAIVGFSIQVRRSRWISQAMDEDDLYYSGNSDICPTCGGRGRIKKEVPEVFKKAFGDK